MYINIRRVSHIYRKSLEESMVSPRKISKTGLRNVRIIKITFSRSGTLHEKSFLEKQVLDSPPALDFKLV